MVNKRPDGKWKPTDDPVFSCFSYPPFHKFDLFRCRKLYFYFKEWRGLLSFDKMARDSLLRRLFL